MQKAVSGQSPLCQPGRKREDLWWEGFVKEVGFELGVKEWRSYRWWQWWIYGKSWTGIRRKIRVQDGETGMRLSEKSAHELLLANTWWCYHCLSKRIWFSEGSTGKGCKCNSQAGFSRRIRLLIVDCWQCAYFVLYAATHVSVCTKCFQWCWDLEIVVARS